MAQHNRVGVGLKHADRILKRLTLCHGRDRLRVLDIQSLTAQAFDRAGKRAKSAAGGFKEQERNNLASQDVRRFAALDKLFHMQGQVENSVEILDCELIQ